MEGFLLVMSGPSGVGKGTIVREILKQREDVVVSISVTTRYMREGERDGVDYFFKSKEEFEDLIKNKKLLEHAYVHGNYYGTPLDFAQEKIKEGKIVILEIDVQGAMQVRKCFDNAAYVFVIPPRMADIEERLRKRGTEDEEKIHLRIQNSKTELEQIKYYDYFLVNDQVDIATDRLDKIIEEEMEKRRK
ncbi:guanylate kinase [Peptoniphilaceae bacterium SGI.131]